MLVPGVFRYEAEVPHESSVLSHLDNRGRQTKPNESQPLVMPRKRVGESFLIPEGRSPIVLYHALENNKPDGDPLAHVRQVLLHVFVYRSFRALIRGRVDLQVEIGTHSHGPRVTENRHLRPNVDQFTPTLVHAAPEFVEVRRHGSGRERARGLRDGDAVVVMPFAGLAYGKGMLLSL